MWKLLQGQPVIALTCAQACKCMLVIWGGSTRGKCRETEVNKCKFLNVRPPVLVRTLCLMSRVTLGKASVNVCQDHLSSTC